MTLIALQSATMSQISSFRRLAIATRKPALLSVKGVGRGRLVVRSSKDSNEHKAEVKRAMEELQKSGMTKEIAEQVLTNWKKEMGQDITPDDLRKVLVKSSTRVTGYLLVQMLLDAGAAYGAYVAGDLLGRGVEQYGVLAIILQAIAFILAGYYAAGVFFDLFKVGALATAFYQFNVNSATFLEAVQVLAGGSTGLNTVDKAREAVNMLRVLTALNRTADMLQQRTNSAANKPDMLRDLGAYLTLEKAQRSFGFDIASSGLSSEQAASIAVVFSSYDKDDSGALDLNEFTRMCAEYAPELSEPEIKAGFKLLDTNSDGQVEFKEFVQWYMKKLQLPQGSLDEAGAGTTV